jgi:putative restriction endonuclease
VTFGVFIHRSDSIYDDTPAEKYQFPEQYLDRARACLGDWIVYYEPRKVAETKGYYAVAKVERIIPDPSTPGMYLALIEPGSYLDFATPIPFADANGPIEQGVLNDQGRISGRAQAAVRGLSASDFNRIVQAGLAEGDALLPRTGVLSDATTVREERLPFGFDETRERVSSLVSRVVRDRVFRRIVLRAYDERCAVTGLKLINGGGRAEVEARTSSATASRFRAPRTGCSTAV